MDLIVTLGRVSRSGSQVWERMSEPSPIEESATNRVTRLLARAKDGNTIARDELVNSVYDRLNGLCKGLKSKFPGVVIYVSAAVDSGMFSGG